MELEPVVFGAAADSGDRETPRASPIQGKDNLTVSISTDILQEARRLKGQIQISQLVEQALAEKIKEIHHPEKAELVKRLRTEREERRGPAYRTGLYEGKRWATEVASWAEIKMYSGMTSADVNLAENDEGWFSGPFDLPWDDYQNFRPVDEEGQPINTAPTMAQLAKGWLAGVKAIYELVRIEMDGVDPDDTPV